MPNKEKDHMHVTYSCFFGVWDMIYAVWVVAIKVAIVLSQIVLTGAIPTNSQVSSNKRSYVTYNTGSSKIQSGFIIVHSVRGVRTMRDSHGDSCTIDIMNYIYISKCRILKNKTMICKGLDDK